MSRPEGQNEKGTYEYVRKLPANFPAVDIEPFGNFVIDDWKILDKVEKRTPCAKCNKSRKYFCYTCYVPVGELIGKIPTVKLPLKIDIIKHAREIDGKSTASHAALLAPDDVKIYTYPNIPDYDQQSGKVVIVFPGKIRKSIEEHVESLGKQWKENNEYPIEKAVFIDSTWNQTRGIYKDPRLKGLPCIVLRNRISQFWRHQEGSPRWYLATIEAIHQLLLEIHGIKMETMQPIHNYDNLLFVFRFMYDKIHQLYDSDTLRSYKRPLDI